MARHHSRKKDRGADRPRERKTAGPERAPRVRLPKVVSAYFFFDDFLLLFLEDLAAAFLVAISLTTFHAVRDLPVAPTWQKTPDCSGKLECEGKGNGRGETTRRPSTVTERFIQFLAIIILLS